MELIHRGLVTLVGALDVEIGSYDGFMHEDTKPLPEPHSTNHQWSLGAFLKVSFSAYVQYMYIGNKFENYHFRITELGPVSEHADSAAHIYVGVLGIFGLEM